MSPLASFCTKCGGPLDPAMRFCANCGAPRVDVTYVGTGAVAGTGAATAPAGAPGAPGAQGVPAAPAPAVVALRAASVAGTVASMSGVLTLPWQTIVAGEAPDVRRLVTAGAPIAQRAVMASLRRPALALLVTTTLDLVVALLSAQPGGLGLVVLRASMGAGTAVLGVIVGRTAGPLRKVTGAASFLTGLVQTGSMVLTAISAASSPGGLLGLVPSIVSQGSSLVMLVKTAVVSLRRTGAARPAPRAVGAR
jgi:hypothetical protein